MRSVEKGAAHTHPCVEERIREGYVNDLHHVTLFPFHSVPLVRRGREDGERGIERFGPLGQGSSLRPSTRVQSFLLRPPIHFMYPCFSLFFL